MTQSSAWPLRLTYFLFVFTILQLLTSCTSNNSHKTSHSSFDFSDMELMADSITYTVVVKNRDTLDTWADQRLSGLNHKKLVDDLFIKKDEEGCIIVDQRQESSIK